MRKYHTHARVDTRMAAPQLLITGSTGGRPRVSKPPATSSAWSLSTVPRSTPQGRFVVHVNEFDTTGSALDPVPAPILLLDNGELVGPADSVTLDSLRRQRRALCGRGCI